MCSVPWFSSCCPSGSIRSLAILLDNDQAGRASGHIQKATLPDRVSGDQISLHPWIVVLRRIRRRPPVAAIAVAPDSPAHHAIFRTFLNSPDDLIRQIFDGLRRWFGLWCIYFDHIAHLKPPLNFVSAVVDLPGAEGLTSALNRRAYLVPFR